MTKVLKVGLIGAGGIAGAHLKAYLQLSQQVRLVAICDVREEAARWRAQEAGITAVYTDAYRMLREADIDAVDICTSHDQHAPLALAAAEAGKHILVEKPMACSLQQCREMVAAAEKARVILMVAQNQRYMPSHRGVRRLIQEGELGVIHAVRFDSMQNLSVFLPPSHWLFDGNQAGGGIVISVSVHKIDLMRYLVGEVKRVVGIQRNFHSEFINGAEDYACALLEFENGALGEMFATYAGFRMPWSEQFMIFGSEGTVHAVPPIGQSGGPAWIASRRRGVKGEGWAQQFLGFVPVEPDQEGLPSEDSFVNEIFHFVECCQTGKEPLSSGRDNLETMKVVFGFYESARTGKPAEMATL